MWSTRPGIIARPLVLKEACKLFLDLCFDRRFLHFHAFFALSLWYGISFLLKEEEVREAR